MRAEIRNGQVTIRQSEQEIQDAVVEVLRAVGCTVYTTNTHGVRRGTGVTKGVPDLLVGHKKFIVGTLIGMEVKKPKGWKWSSVEQFEAFRNGDTNLVFGPVTALEALQFVAQELGEYGIANKAKNLKAQFPVEEFEHSATKSDPKPTAGARR